MDVNENGFIDGPQRAGKGGLAGFLARQHYRTAPKTPLYGFDPKLQMTRWPMKWTTSVPNDFLQLFTAKNPDGSALNRGFIAFIDEVDMLIPGPRKAGEFNCISNKAAGHNDAIVYFLAQRFNQVPPEWRENCARLGLFKVTPARAEYWAQVFQDEDIARFNAALHKLPLYHYIWKESGKAARLCKPVPYVK